MSQDSAPPAPLKQTALNATHRDHGAKMVDFGGWDMPVQYSGLVDEHHAVRRAAGLFDVSHMGEIDIRGPQALDLVDHISSNWAAKLQTGQAHYSGLLYETGGFVDDILVHKVADDHYFICVNAGNQEKDFAHIVEHNRFDATVELSSDRYTQLAIQGPRALEVLQKLTKTPLAAIKYYWFTDGEVAGTPARIARTGYTGEDGFEIYFAPAESARIWRALLVAGEEFGLKPAGLGARNTLRLEAKMALYGHEIDASISPLEAGLSWIVKFDKPDFIGRAALLAQKGQLTRQLVGFEMTGRGIGRDGYEAQIGGVKAGWVTSGSPSPTLSAGGTPRNIGLCYLPTAHTAVGTEFEILVRNQPVGAVVAPTPFYKRGKA
ncbi:MAG: glycine cleavage system aminomethyltransferase GcvT [Bryobacteraceae bacterium]|nr:glycine cleavage system aminomethyltransferase GcvT [Bryobacteraceae bacterium]